MREEGEDEEEEEKEGRRGRRRGRREGEGEGWGGGEVGGGERGRRKRGRGGEGGREGGGGKEGGGKEEVEGGVDTIHTQQHIHTAHTEGHTHKHTHRCVSQAGLASHTAELPICTLEHELHSSAIGHRAPLNTSTISVEAPPARSDYAAKEEKPYGC